MISREAHWPWSMNLPQVSLLAKKVIAKHVQFTEIENWNLFVMGIREACTIDGAMNQTGPVAWTSHKFTVIEN
jgi:hypothetical protein